MPNATRRQQNSLHLWFRRLAEALNDAGYDVRKTLREDVEVPWTEALVKELMFRKIMEVMTEKGSTTELNRVELSDVVDVLNRHLGEKLGIHVPFPSEDDE